MNPEMQSSVTKEEAKPMLVPKWRFPEFRNGPNWPQLELGSIAVILKGKGIAKADLDPSGSQACIRYGELYTRYGETIRDVVSRTKVPASELFLSKPDDVIIPSSGETKIDIAKASCVLAGDIALGGDLNVIRSKLSGMFLSYYLNGPKRTDIAKVAQGDTVVHLYAHQLKALYIAVPSPAEQQKIADCLSSLDELITAQARKVDALKTQKEGLMLQLFPREGETEPRLRISDFRGTGEWQKKKISTLLKKLIHPVDVNSAKSYREIGIRSHGKGIFHKEPTPGKALGDKRVFWVIEDALVLNIVFAWEQALAVTSAEEVGMIASHRFPMFKAILGKADVNFIKYFFLTGKGKELLGIASPGGAGRNKTLGKKDFDNLEFLLPCNVEEQNSIANLLTSVDALITSQIHQLETLKTHKKGLMQQLFPAAEALEA